MNLTKYKNSFHRNLVKVLFLLVFTGVSVASQAQVFEGGDAEKGEKLFKSNCAACHSITSDVVAAPGLGGIVDRWGSTDEMMIQWIKNPKKALETGDPYVQSLIDQYQSSYGLMAGQSVNDQQIKDIFAYVQNPPVKDDSGEKINECATIHDDDTVFTGSKTIWIAIIAILFIIVAGSTFSVSKTLKRTVDLQAGRVPEDLSALQSYRKWKIKRKELVGIVGLVLVCWFIGWGYGRLMNIGVYEGYEPEQPIQFSHAIHNCENDIDCQYCHFLAEDSKTAGIPPVNVCMNCHKGIKKGSRTGKAEIQKIYDAIGFDPAKGKYIEDYEQKPIKWVKVHNLPDHVYFSHQQHVAVGKLDCKQCHGPVETFVSGRISPVEETNAQNIPGLIKLEEPTLTMAWCVECHSKAKIDLATGGYYQEMHKRMTEEGNHVGNKEYARIMEDGVATVKEMGGWECAKCHY